MWGFLPLTAECNLNYCLRVSISFLLLNELLQPNRLILKLNIQKKAKIMASGPITSWLGK